jgi:hypothetical protein
MYGVIYTCPHASAWQVINEEQGQRYVYIYRLGAVLYLSPHYKSRFFPIPYNTTERETKLAKRSPHFFHKSALEIGKQNSEEMEKNSEE